MDFMNGKNGWILSLSLFGSYRVSLSLSLYAKREKALDGLSIHITHTNHRYYEKYVETNSLTPVLHFFLVMVPLGYYLTYFKGGVRV